MAGSSSYNPGYPTLVCAPNIVTMKLSGRDNYDAWRIQMLCLLESHDMLHFILPTENSSVSGDQRLWRRSDAVVKGWILGSLSQKPLEVVVILVKTNTYITSKDVWDKLHTIYGPPALPLQDAAAEIKEVEEEKRTGIKEIKKNKRKALGRLYAATLIISES
ncbi:hypothetical protein HanRHA438_Chr04g0161521 [Helianthus annuus]|uniref:Putative gag-polypeptide of LTR copia-type n=1 Tax=Helianthus annuus TaxID=4232 RepID=A0A251UWH8_HELAN|nr:hypothetical protein HanXRQr2_Chr04g0151601 [Helianthus annuus]KAJ0925601.1 hypothetical protein HanRHA438_Chr04g0161521 [Helianthus annuus]